MKTLCKIDRFMAWVLLFGMILFFVTGYGMTKGVINIDLAVDFHNKYLPVIVIIAFLYHAGYATRLALIRWKWWSWPFKTIWFLFFAGFLFAFIYIDQCYKQTRDTTETTTLSTEINNNISNTTDNSQILDENGNKINSSIDEGTSNPRVFNEQELAKYNGQNGNPAYVAVDGKVYDLTSVFNEGKHYSHYAGKELTNAFYSYHVSRALSKYPVVGEYIE